MSRTLLRPGQSIRGERSEIVILEWIGEGSYARVYRGEAPEGPAAIKLAKSEVEGAAPRLHRERQVHAALRHAAIPELRDAGELPAAGGATAVPWLAVRWVPGETLRRRLERHRGLPLVQVVPMLARLADAVAALHAAGWVHGDLRPDNILLETSSHHAFLLDLGEAEACAAARSTHSVGTRAFGVRGDGEPHTPSADARQLAGLLAWSLTGVNPAQEPDRLTRSAGHPPAVLQLWCEAGEGRLPPSDFRDRLNRIAHQLGLPAPARL